MTEIMVPTNTEIVTDVEKWATRIRRHMVTAVEAVIATGRDLAEAKKALGHGNFGKLCAELNITTRTAQRLMAIAAHPVLGDATRASQLPPSWATLYELTRMTEAGLQHALDTGAVTPRMERKAARQLVAAVMSRSVGHDIEAWRKSWPTWLDGSRTLATVDEFDAWISTGPAGLFGWPWPPKVDDRGALVVALEEHLKLRAAKYLLRTGILLPAPKHLWPTEERLRKMSEWEESVTYLYVEVIRFGQRTGFLTDDGFVLAPECFVVDRTDPYVTEHLVGSERFDDHDFRWMLFGHFFCWFSWPTGSAVVPA